MARVEPFVRPGARLAGDGRRSARHECGWLALARWIGTGAGVSGAAIIALDLGVVVYGFGLFLVSSLLWSAIGWVQREPSLMLLQTAFTVINVMGIYRWMIP